MIQPKNALVKQYKRLFELDGVELEFEEDALDAVVEKAIERKTGARGLRSIIEGILRDVMFQSPSDKTIVKVTVTAETVMGKEPEIKRDPDREKKLKEAKMKEIDIPVA